MCDPDGWRDIDQTQREEIARLRADGEHSFKRILELEAALKPFADAIDRHDADWKEKIGGDVLVSDDEMVEFINGTGEYVGLVSIGDFRRARAALGGCENPDT